MKTKFIVEDIFGLKEIAEEMYKHGYDWTKLKGFKVTKVGNGALIELEQKKSE